MKRFVLLLFSISLFNISFAQEFTGQWKGQFTDNSTSFIGWGGDKCDYVLELESRGDNVTGYSYTYFTDGGKRYYTICRLTGKIDKKSKSVEVTEVERTKTNVPNHIRNCFQIHHLTFFKKGDVQTLEGNWNPAPNQEGDCGFGTTVLSRRMLKKETPVFNNAAARNTPKKSSAKPKNNFTDKNKTVAPPVVTNNNKPQVNTPSIKPATPVKPELKQPETTAVKTETTLQPKSELSADKRNTNILKTIELDNLTFRVDLYDNGEIDGDSISLFFNGKLLLSHKRLSDKAITLTLTSDDSRPVNELVMYAENLGEIPPNTALMVVTDGDKRYEVRITSDLEKSGTIHFVHKSKNAQ
ncbi:MAG: hypothetical protein JST86_20305 [Bacteroidetes bacterium]|nr:hypothetical protein [Bacteroidota bacterium]